jgi:hypothetical protein
LGDLRNYLNGGTIVYSRLISQELLDNLELEERDHELEAMMRNIDWNSPADEMNRYLFASEIVNQATDLVELVDPTSLMLNTRNYDQGTTNIKIKDTAGYEAKTVTSGGYKETIRLDNEITSMPVPRRYDHVSLEFLKEDLEVGTYEDISDIRVGIAEGLLRKKINTVWAACNDAITSADDATTGVGNENHWAVGASAIDEATLNAAIDRVDTYGGGAYSIIGAPEKVNAIASMSSFQNIMPERAKLDYWRTGFLGIYRGARILKLPSLEDKKYNMSPTDKTNVFVVGAGFGEIANIRGVTASTWSNDKLDTQVISAQHKYVVFTYQPEGACRMEHTG